MTVGISPSPFEAPCPELGAVCRRLAEAGRKITLRAAASELGVAHTTLSRDAAKRLQLEECQKLAETVLRIARNNRGRLGVEESEMLAEAKRKIAKLEDQNALLIASHQAMIMAVGELGGMRAWRRFFEDYQSIVDRLVDCGAIPQSGEIINAAERLASVRKDQAGDQKLE
ncbi:MAG: hypothetical protein JKP96_10540 [Oceanicaulis sp.]|nr:hypothetical protein [Oceanicaulis sp.]